MNLRRKTVQGVGWTSAAQLVVLIIQFVVSAILAHLLFPEDFGMIAMIVVFSNFISVFRDLGMGASIVQKKGLNESQTNTVFWIATGVGLWLSLLMVCLSPLIAIFYKQPQLTKLSMALGLTFFIASLGIVPSSLLQKEMRFKTLSAIKIAAALSGGLIAVFFALKGFGVWSLVYRQIASTVIGSFLFLIIKQRKFSFSFKWQETKEMFKFGAHFTGFSFINYFNRNLDNLLIGKFIGPQSLGLYNFSYNIMLYPVTQISGVLGQVFFPVFSSIQDDLFRIRKIYTKATLFISVITFPLMIGLFVVAPEFVRVIFGTKWINTILIIRILSLAGLTQSVGATVGWIYLSQNKTDTMFKWGIFSFFIATLGFVVGLQWGVIGVTAGYVVTTYLLIIPSYYIPFRFIDMNIWSFFKNLVPTFSASVIMGVVVWFLRYIMKMSNFTDLVVLTICIITGALVYIALIALFKREIFRDIINYLNMGFSLESLEEDKQTQI